MDSYFRHLYYYFFYIYEHKAGHVICTIYGLYYDSFILVSLWRDSATRYMSQAELWPKHRIGLLYITLLDAIFQ